MKMCAGRTELELEPAGLGLLELEPAGLGLPRVLRMRVQPRAAALLRHLSPVAPLYPDPALLPCLHSHHCDTLGPGVAWRGVAWLDALRY